MNNILASIIEKEINSYIIGLLPDIAEGPEKDFVNDDPSFDYLLNPDLNEEEQELYLSNPVVDRIIIFQDIDRVVEKREEVIFLPGLIGNPVKLRDYLGYLRRFISLQFVGDSRRANFLIGRAIHCASQFYEKQQILEFIDNLWEQRWLVDSYNTAKWKFSILFDSNEVEMKEKCCDNAYMSDFCEEIIEQVEQIKEISVDVAAWIKKLYNISPNVFFALLMTQNNSTDEGKKYDRFFDEVQADLGTTLSIFFSAVKNKDLKHFSNTYFNRLFEESHNLDEFKQKLRYHYKSRTIIPKFWYNTAIAATNSNPMQIPEELDIFNHKEALSYNITLSKDFLDILLLG